ncbi:MAG: hypothetical protein F9K24_15965 [Leptonema illini]|uniref:Uncharacterized protein n=1 Tax=Leptonema illini TaxID=183 RepID=A0A833GZI1_9LEPT|nr:MAG: hypothetical protein F9K24_15965 [Leptonema illini]
MPIFSRDPSSEYCTQGRLVPIIRAEMFNIGKRASGTLERVLFAIRVASVSGGLLALLLFSLPLQAEIYKPPGQGAGQNMEGTGYGVDTGVKDVDGDYYVTITPIFELPLFGFRIGLQVPLEVLVYDREPASGEKVPSLRPGMYNENSDYMKLVKYVRKGTHLYYNPDDLFNWSFFYGEMTDGYIGHRTIIHRYVSSYDPTLFRPGLMADINNNWGGVEVFLSDVWTREVRGGRAYVRPVGIFVTGWNAFVARDFNSRDVARSVAENRRARREYLFQERVPDQGQGGALREHLYRPLREDLEDSKIEFVEVKDPVTGETKIEPVLKEDLPPSKLDPTLEKPPDRTDTKKSSKLDQGFWSRWAIGATRVMDSDAPLELEVDGSENLVIDPYTLLPRSIETENLTIEGVDTELRLSPFTWLDLTAYIDRNRIKGLDNAEGTHMGLIFEMQFSSLLRWFVRPEYREATSNYLPTYFDSYYAVERTTYLPSGATSSTTPKLAYLKSLPDDGEITKGYFVNSTLEFVEYVTLEAEYQDYDGPNNSAVMVGLYIPDMGGIFANGYYKKKEFDKMKEAFIVNENALMAAEAGLRFFGGMYIKYTFRRTWVYEEAEGRYTPVDESGVGFGYSSSL